MITRNERTRPCQWTSLPFAPWSREKRCSNLSGETWITAISWVYLSYVMLWLNINIAGNARKIFTIVHSFSVRVKKKKKSNYSRRCFNNFALWNLWDSSNSVWREEKLWKCVFFFFIYQFKRNLNFACSEFIKSVYFKLNVWNISERKMDIFPT